MEGPVSMRDFPTTSNAIFFIVQAQSRTCFSEICTLRQVRSLDYTLVSGISSTSSFPNKFTGPTEWHESGLGGVLVDRQAEELNSREARRDAKPRSSRA